MAKEEGIPVRQRVPRERAIRENDRFIPAGWIEPMAEMLRWVKEFHGEQH